MKKFGLMTKVRSKSEKKADRTEKVPTRKTFLPRTRSRRPRAKAPSLPGRKTSEPTKPRPKGAPGHRRGAGRHRVPHRTPPPKPRLSRSEGFPFRSPRTQRSPPLRIAGRAVGRSVRRRRHFRRTAGGGRRTRPPLPRPNEKGDPKSFGSPYRFLVGRTSVRDDGCDYFL